MTTADLEIIISWACMEYAALQAAIENMQVAQASIVTEAVRRIETKGQFIPCEEVEL